MSIFNKSLITIAAVATLVSQPALAQHSVHFVTAGDAITGTGIGFIGSTVCITSWVGTVGTDVSAVEGSAHIGHADYVDTVISNSGAAGCDNYTTYARLWSNGDVSNLAVWSDLHQAFVCVGSGVYEEAAVITGDEGHANAVVAGIAIGGACGIIGGSFDTDEAGIDDHS